MFQKITPRRIAAILSFVIGAAVTTTLWIGIGSLKWGILKVVEQGHHTWAPVESTDLPGKSWHRLAHRRDIRFSPSEVTWIRNSGGIRVGELPVLIEGENQPVDTFLITVIDPRSAKFSVHVSPESYRDVDEWADALNAQVVINGSYYSKLGQPDTPLVSFGELQGPSTYKASHGAFVIGSNSTQIVDLQSRTWKESLKNARHGFVSYPMLLDAQQNSRSEGRNSWLANRSFVGVTRSGEIVLATSSEAFFTLENLSKFLRQSPLDLDMALNLDGGPVAGLTVRLPGYQRTVYGRHETQVRENKELVLKPGIPGKKYPLPIVLAVNEL